jgi:hypothetical protein
MKAIHEKARRELERMSGQSGAERRITTPFAERSDQQVIALTAPITS